MWLIVYYYLVWQWHITRTLVSILKDLFLMHIPWTWVKEPSVLNMMIELHFCLSDQWMGLRYDIYTNKLNRVLKKTSITAYQHGLWGNWYLSLLLLNFSSIP